MIDVPVTDEIRLRCCKCIRSAGWDGFCPPLASLLHYVFERVATEPDPLVEWNWSLKAYLLTERGQAVLQEHDNRSRGALVLATQGGPA